MKTMFIKSLCLISLSLVLLLQGCTGNSTPPEPVTLKVWGFEGSYNDFVDDVGLEFPHIIFSRVLPYRELEMGCTGPCAPITDWEAYFNHAVKAIDERQPDILLPA